MIVQLTLLLAAISAGVESQSFYRRPTYATNNRAARCSSPTKPCRLRITMETASGNRVQTSAAYMCSCNFPYTCSNDWTRTQNVVHRNLQSYDYNITLHMMFCGPVQPRRICSEGEISLTVSGYLNIPNDLDSYNCRCADNTPLQLHERSYINFRYSHSYVCHSHKPICTEAQMSNCLTVSPQSSSYHCRCPEQTSCRVPTVGPHYRGTLNGTCS